MILLDASAGAIIQTFGRLVVGGNFVVGGIIFLIITIVQFIVVTKGAERVAEVAARFTLDAMPGKQMSIDADMRSGVIDANQARELRLMLTKESQLYGAMDGAMKFVKGDVIASIVIAIINIVGGLIVGSAMHGMSLYQAAQVYTLLSIGAGLVTQIPSLLISMTAGIVTTRVSSERKRFPPRKRDHLATFGPAQRNYDRRLRHLHDGLRYPDFHASSSSRSLSFSEASARSLGIKSGAAGAQQPLAACASQAKPIWTTEGS